MATPDTRLLGALAVQLGFLDARTLKARLQRFGQRQEAFSAWLVKEGALTAPDAALLDAVAARTVQAHGGGGNALTALAQGAQAFTESFTGLDDTVQSGEQRVPDSLEGLDFVVPELPGRYLPAPGGELGRGGIGRVVAQRDQVLGRTVALKELLGEHLNSPTVDTRASVDQEARFLREARLAAQLEHPAIVPVYEAGRRVDGALYYTMRRIEGRTLFEAVKSAATLDGRLKLMPHLVAVAQALAYAHSREVIHRDVKPQNVMLGRFGETYLLDWGLARMKGRAERRSLSAAAAPDITGGLRLGAVGTPSYMSPEQAAGRVDELDERTDVWGVGAVLFEVLTGRPPYVGTSAIDCVQRILTDEVLPVRELEPNAPGDLVAVCEKALQRDPAQRYRSAGELATDLQAWLEGRTVSAREYSSVALAGRLVRRNRGFVAVVGALVVALVASAAVFTHRLATERREARALSSFVLNNVVRGLAWVPGAERTIDAVATPAIAFYRRQGALSDEERAVLAGSLHTMTRLATNVGRRDEALRYARECSEVVPVDALSSERTSLGRSTALACLSSLHDLALLADDVTEQQRLLGVMRGVVERYAGEPIDDAEWATALSLLEGRLGRDAQMRQDSVAASRHLERELALSERALALSPDDPGLKANLVSVLTSVSLVHFRPEAPQQAIADAERGLATIRGLPLRYQNVRVLRTWLGLLQHYVTVLAWAGRAEAMPPLVDEARRVFDMLMAHEPKDVQGRGMYADFLLAITRPCEALAVLDVLHAEGLRGEYLSSRLLAALACGADAPFADAAADITAASDPQTHWLQALWLVKVGRGPEAARVLAEWKERSAQASVQWPFGVLDGLPARAPAPHRAALEAFVRATEAALRGEAGDESLLAIFEALEAAVR